ncbi:MAG: GlxA family transcriptional regulator [Paracoccaceae bacterium]
MTDKAEQGDRRPNRFVARGAAHVEVDTTADPVRVAFVLVPQFTMLAFTSAVEPLRAANQLSGKTIFEWQVFSESGQPITASNGVPLVPDGPLPKEAPAGYVLICGGVEPEVTTTATLADWIRAQWRRGRIVGSLCSGAYTLARAGILKGRTFTLHWENIPGFREAYPDLEPARRVYCIDDRLITCAGGVAAAELSLKLIHDHCGAELSQAAMNMCLLSQRRQPDDDQMTSLATRLGTRNEHVVKAVSYMEARLEEEFHLDDCAAHVGVTRRQIQRLFQQFLGVTPIQYLNTLRLQRGRALLSETNMSVMEVAVSSGYVSASHFAKSFRKKYGVSPNRFSHFSARKP